MRHYLALTTCLLLAVIFTPRVTAQTAKGIVRERDVVLVALDEETAKLAKLTPHLAVNVEGHSGAIRALAFSADSLRLFSGGMDKVVHVWTLPGADGSMPRAIVRDRRGWQKSHSIRWEMARGLRGSIYTLAAAPRGDRVAIAGLSARGAQGEIIWADVDNGTFKATDHESHAIAVVSLSYSPDGRWMASSDTLGGVNLHDIESGESKRIHFDRLSTQIRPVAMLGNTHVLLVHAAGTIRARKPDGNIALVPTFELQRYSIAQGRVVGNLSPVHIEYVSALAASSDGRLAASADGGRNLYLHKLTGAEPQPISLQKGHVVVSLAFSGDGRYLAAGTLGESGREASQIQIWDTAARRLIYSRPTVRPVNAVAMSPDGRWLAHTGDESHNVLITELTDGEPSKPRPMVLAGGERITSVAAIDRAGGFQTMFETSSGATRNFNPAALDARPLAEGPPRVRTMSNDTLAGAWTVDVSTDRTLIRLRQRGVARGLIRLDPSFHGLISNPQAWCFIGDEDGDPMGIAIGTEIQSGVYVFDLAPSGECKLLRYFRGHDDQVTSLSATRDGRYLVSGSADGTIRYWKLAGLDGRTVPRRWGAELGLADDGLQADKVVDTGPLFHKGVRDGDVIEKILWTEIGTDGRPQVFSTAEPRKMYEQLQALPWYQQFTFITRRDGERQAPFNLVSGWNHLLAVFAFGDDWIAWHPSGYYACSPGGERLVGWHVNRDVGLTPKLYPAVRFHKLLHKPEEMQSLLARGGLDKPEQAVFQPPPLPIVEIIDPAVHRVSLKKGFITVRARARAQGSEPIKSMQLLINGVPAPQFTKAIERVRLVSSASDWVEREWTVPIVAGQHTIAVRADDAADLYDISPGLIVKYEIEKARRTLHLLTIGVNDYVHDEISDLRYAVSDGARIESIFTARSKGLYDDVTVTHVRDRDATRANILAAMQDVAERATMNDLVVLFYSGHGYRIEKDFFFVCCDADRSCLVEKGLSSKDLKTFCKDVGAKSAKMLLLVDACHSGAMNLDDLTQDLAHDDFNVAMMVSSRGSQVSWEDATFGEGGGAFTHALHLGLALGRAQNPNIRSDGIIDNRELGEYVEQVVDAEILDSIRSTLRERFPFERFPDYYTDGEIRQQPVSNFLAVDRIELTRAGE